MDNFPPLPFLTRDMLTFGNSSTIQLIVNIVGHDGHTFDLRGMTRSGLFTRRFRIVGNSSVESFTFNLPDIPINITLAANEADNIEAIAHATVHLAVDGNRMGTLAQGIVNGLFGISWPYQHPLSDPQISGGILQPTFTNPAAGAEINDTVPDNQIWEVLAYGVTLVTDSNAANRTVNLDFTFPDGSVMRRSSGTTQQASEQIDYNFIPGGTTAEVLANTTHEIALPARLILPAGSTITSTTTNKQAGDNYNQPHATVRVTYISN